MKFLFLISGSLRMIKKNITHIINKINNTNIEYDIYLYKSHDKEKKYNEIDENLDIDIINKLKLLLNGDEIKFNDKKYNIEQENTMKQWIKLHELFMHVRENEYDYIVRMRPDIEILSSDEELIKIFNNLSSTKMYIPKKLMHDQNIINKYNNFEHINDQICICSYKIMKCYVNFATCINNYAMQYPFVSEIMLKKYLDDEKIVIEKIDFDYKLNLSSCNIIGISGDSGAGKSTILHSIQKMLIFDNYIKLETDRYHKWERYDKNWEIYTHLDPNSNYLEKMNTDMYNLKLGLNIFQVDYDHDAGKFTQLQKIEGANGYIFCGLHTLHSEKILNLIDIKIYVDTQDEIKKIWKLRRDILERNYTFEKVIENIKKRENDYVKYIKPQTNNAQVIVKYFSNEKLDIKKYNEYETMNIECEICIVKNYFLANEKKLIKCEKMQFEKKNDYYVMKMNTHDVKSIIEYIKYNFEFIDETSIETNKLCYIQLLILMLLYDKKI
jgi:uridine kinase